MPFIQKSVQAATLAPDLPNASEASRQHPDGAIYASETAGEFKGKRYKLRHARWVPVVVRDRKKK
jgi:hypothetical protein